MIGLVRKVPTAQFLPGAKIRFVYVVRSRKNMKMPTNVFANKKYAAATAAPTAAAAAAK